MAVTPDEQRASAGGVFMKLAASPRNRQAMPFRLDAYDCDAGAGEFYGSAVSWKWAALHFLIAPQSTAVHRRAHGTPSLSCVRSHASTARCSLANQFLQTHLQSRGTPSQFRDVSAILPSGTRYQRGIQSPYAASAANASGFLLVPLSKMPRLGLHPRPHALRRRISDQG